MGKGILTGLLEDIKEGMEDIDSNNVSNSKELETVESKEVKPFDYSLVDADTAEFLSNKALKIMQIQVMSVLALGKELKEAQTKLANYDKGTFYKWFQSIGFKKDTVYRNINAYEWAVANCDNLEDAEKIQTALLYSVSKPSAPLELQEMVLSGDITTHKQYRELEEKLKAAQKEVSEAKQHYETISKSYDQLEKKNHEHYEKARELEKELKAAKEQLLEAQSFGDDEEVERLKQLLQDTENELEDSKKRVEELELDDNNEIVAAVVERVPDEVLEELAELRSRSSSIEACAELKTLLKVLNSDILNLGRFISTIKENNNIAMECISYIGQVRENMILLKKISLESLNRDLFDFIKD